MPETTISLANVELAFSAHRTSGCVHVRFYSESFGVSVNLVLSTEYADRLGLALVKAPGKLKARPRKPKGGER